METERWADVVGFEGVYSVSTLGRVMRVKGGAGCQAGRILKPDTVTKGYLRVCLYMGKRGNARRPMVHQIVAAAFLGPCPSGYQVNHIDGNKTNNRPGNLEYVTLFDNIRHANATGLHDMRGEKHPQHKLTPMEVQKVRNLYATGAWSQRALAAKFAISQTQIGRIVRNESW